MPRMTRHELEEENETLRSKLEEAHELISEALGYEDAEPDDEDDQLDEDDEP